ncbi:DUF2252 family protein [Euzebya tangerina]|uniref:DUF2252 family protein n=1 Tax=Euzebya tangerina TaxID=591198 RepID=UPI00196BAB08|nr:DUF2252 family protein [Euzebya tangerina]
MSDDTPNDLTGLTKDELYARAQEHDIEGRSTMSKEELRAALSEAEAPVPQERTVDRVEDFRRLAEARAAGEFVLLPRSLTGQDRRLHVRETLREDHTTRIMSRAADAELKFEELADSLFSFFRGTALLFYRDMAGDDAWMPTVLALGDVHPENFGVMPNAHNVPIFSVNDFDEALYAPFTWDIKRGAVGFMAAAKEIAGYGHKKRRRIVRHFVKGYVAGITNFAEHGTESDDEMRLDSAPDLIVDLIEDAEESRAEWLQDDYLDDYKRGFRADDEHVPISSRREEFQEIIDRLITENDIEIPDRTAGMRVKDVCIRRGQGTASLGLDRFYVLIEGPQADGTDDVIIELKQARRSALTGLVPPTPYGLDTWGDTGAQGHRAGRIVHAQGVQLVRGDVFYGSVEIDGVSFMSRERAPFRDDIDLDDLSKKEWRRYAKICGWVLAHAHALSDELGALEHDIEPEILAAIGEVDLFVDDIVQFAEEAMDRLKKDHRTFQVDHAMGAFQQVDRIFV